ncbi:MAG: Wzt carbohydrate-binding domain-containing protein, partial [Anaerolineales bacterium]|nr:Wzt carbohydrate-binding domain-containing protein [Anaerolineales bacterium]
GTVFKYGNPESIINSYNFLIAKKTRGEQISYKNGQMSSGYGNHKVTIDAVDICNKENHPAEIFISGHPAKIIIRMTGHEDVDNFTVGITIRDRFGQDMYGTNSYHLENPISIKKNQTIAVSYDFKEFNLGAGKYSISPAIHTGPTHIEECMHWMDGCAVFEVIVEDGSFLGLVRLMPELGIAAG